MLCTYIYSTVYNHGRKHNQVQGWLYICVCSLNLYTKISVSIRSVPTASLACLN